MPVKGRDNKQYADLRDALRRKGRRCDHLQRGGEGRQVAGASAPRYGGQEGSEPFESAIAFSKGYYEGKPLGGPS